MQWILCNLKLSLIFYNLATIYCKCSYYRLHKLSSQFAFVGYVHAAN